MTNEEIIKRWPFLEVKNEWSADLLPEDEAPTIWEIPYEGWSRAFGDLMWDEIKEELIREGCLDDWEIKDLKEKFGHMILYHDGAPYGKIDTIIDKYQLISSHTCCLCGKPDVHILAKGWILPMCEDCYAKTPRCRGLTKSKIHDLYLEETANTYATIPDFIRDEEWSKSNKVYKSIWIKPTVDKVRKRYANKKVFDLV